MSRRLDWSGLNANFGFTRKKGCTIFSLSCRMLEICWVMIHTITEIVIYFFIWVKFRENLLTIYLRTVFENRRKSIIQQCGRVDKSSLKIPKMVNLASFWKTEVCLSNMLPDRSILIGQKLVKMTKFKWDILVYWNIPVW